MPLSWTTKFVLGVRKNPPFLGRMRVASYARTVSQVKRVSEGFDTRWGA